MSIDVNGPRCRCGNYGCWELYASEKALLTKAQGLGLELKDNHSLTDIINLARDENPEALKLLKEIGRKLGQGIINIIHTFNPQQIIIGNKLAAVQTWIAPSVQEVINDYTLPFHQMDIQVNYSDLSLPASAFGVAAFTTENFLKSHLQ